MSDLDMLSDIPGFTAILKAVLKSQIQFLVDQLANRTGEDYFVLTANVGEGSLGHLGSKKGKTFLATHAIVKTLFLGHCMKDNETEAYSKSSDDAYLSYHGSTSSDCDSGATHQKPHELNGTRPVSRKRQLSGTHSAPAETIPAKVPYAYEKESVDSTESSADRDVTKSYVGDNSYLMDEQEVSRVVPHETETGPRAIKVEEDATESGVEGSNAWPIYGYDNSYTTATKTTSAGSSDTYTAPAAAYPWYAPLSVADGQSSRSKLLTSKSEGSESAVDVPYTQDNVPEAQQTDDIPGRPNYEADDIPGRPKYEKPLQYACDICSRLFNRKYNMMQHRQLHLGIKQFVCELCDKQFARQDRLKFHQLKHHSGALDFKQKFMENV